MVQAGRRQGVLSAGTPGGAGAGRGSWRHALGRKGERSQHVKRGGCHSQGAGAPQGRTPADRGGRIHGASLLGGGRAGSIRPRARPPRHPFGRHADMSTTSTARGNVNLRKFARDQRIGTLMGRRGPVRVSEPIQGQYWSAGGSTNPGAVLVSRGEHQSRGGTGQPGGAPIKGQYWSTGGTPIQGRYWSAGGSGGPGAATG